jgi:hypothetical protein
MTPRTRHSNLVAIWGQNVFRDGEAHFVAVSSGVLDRRQRASRRKCQLARKLLQVLELDRLRITVKEISDEES